MNAALTEPRQPEREAEQRHPLISDGQIRAVLIAVTCGVALAGAGQSSAAAALPEITSEIGALIHLSWPVTGYLVGTAVTMPLYGKLSDAFGRRPAYLLAMMIFMAGAVFAGQSSSIAELVISTALQGVGAGGLLTLGFVLYGDLTSPQKRATGRSFLVATWAIAALAGPAIGGLVSETFGWHWVYYLNLPAGMLVLLVVGTTLTVHIRQQERDLDVVGALLLALGLGLILLYIAWNGPVRGWASSSSLVLLAEGIAAIVLFLAWENRVAEPLLPLDLLRNRTLIRATLAGTVLGSAMFGVVLVLPLHAQVFAGASPALSGLLTLPVAVGAGGTVAITVNGQRDEILARAGAGTVLAALLLLAWRPPSAMTWETVLALLVLLVAGAGLGVAWRALSRFASDAAPAQQASSVVSLGLFLQVIGSAVGGCLLGAVLASGLAQYGPIDLLTTPNLRPSVLRTLPESEQAAVLASFDHALTLVLIVAACVVAIGLLLTFLITAPVHRTADQLAAWESVTELVKPEPKPSKPAPEKVIPAPAPTPAVHEEIPLPGTGPPEPQAPLPELAASTVVAPPPKRAEKPAKPKKPPREYPWTHWSKRRQLVTASAAAFLTISTLYGGGLLYAGPGLLRGTSVHGVDIGNLQPAEAQRKVADSLTPAAMAPVPVKAGVQALAIDPKAAGLGIDPAATVAGSARGSFNPIRLFTVIFTADRDIPLRTTSDPVRLTTAMQQVDQQVHRDPTDGTILFTTGTPQIVDSRNGQSVDIRSAASTVRASYLQRPISLPLTVLPPRVSNAEIRRAMHDFAIPAVSGPVTVNAEGKTAVLPPQIFATHLGVAPDVFGRLHPTVDGDGVLRDGSQLLSPLQSWPKAEVSKIVRKKKVVIEPGYDGHVIGKEDMSTAMAAALQDGSRVANVPLTTVHP